MKMMSRYETVLATECGVRGCEAVLKEDASAEAERRHFLWNACVEDAMRHKNAARYVDRGKNLLMLVLMAGLVAKIFYSIEMSSFAQTSTGVEVYDDFAEVSGVKDSVPGYREYEATFTAVYPKQEIRVGVENCVRYEEQASASAAYKNDTETEIECTYAETEIETGLTVKPVICKGHNGSFDDSIYTAEDSLVEFNVSVKEEGFYSLMLEYYPLKGSGSAVERSILIDGEVPYRELAGVCYDRVWILKENAGKADTKTDGSPVLAEQKEWITDAAYDRERRIAEPLSVYLTKGEHTVSMLAIKESMLLHQIIFSPKEQIQEYRQVKGFWDAVGIRAAQGNTIMVEAEQAVRVSSPELYPVQKESALSVLQTKLRTQEKEAGRGIIGGDSWKKAGAWIEWEFEVSAAGYYHISMYNRQNYAWGDKACRKIMLDGVIPFQEMEHYGFVYGMGWKEDTLADDAGAPYVFYLKEGQHTLRMEAVPGETNPGVSAIEKVQPLAIDWIRIIPADL